jgi:protein-disulfide isomerase
VRRGAATRAGSGAARCCHAALAVLLAVAAPRAREATASPAGRSERVEVEAATASALPVLGPRHAPVTMELFADPGDGFLTSQFHVFLRDLARRHPRRLRVVYRLTGRLLPSGPPGPLILAALEAHDQGRFFDFLDALYHGTMQSPRPEAVPAIAVRAGVDPSRLAAALADDSPLLSARLEVVRANHRYRRRHRVARVPALLVNGLPFERRPSTVEDLEAIYDDALLRAEARLADGVPLERLFATLVAERERGLPPPADDEPVLLDGMRPGDPSLSAAPTRVRLDPRRGDALGPRGARITLTLFCNLVSRRCASAAAVLRELTEIYDGDVRVVFRHFFDPADPEQEDAALAARLLWCAGRLGHFAAFHDVLLLRRGRQLELDDPSIDGVAAAHGVDPLRLRRCRGSSAAAQAVAAEVAAARREGVSRTPSIVLDGRLLLGVRTFEDLGRRIDRALAPGVLGALERGNPGNR